MKTIYIPLLLLLALMTSCSYDFELKGMDAAEKLVLYCMPDADSDTTLIQLYRSQPVTRQKKKRSEEHTSELQSRQYLVCRLLLEKKKQIQYHMLVSVCVNKSDEVVCYCDSDDVAL